MDSDIRAVQLKALEVLKVFADYCEENGLRYFLDYGTCLGAARHKGFIPWDDDVDVGMPRADYEKFRLGAKEALAKHHIAVLDTHEVLHSTRMFLKLFDTRTTYIAANAHYPDVYFGIFIDVFPYDGFPDNKLEGWLLRKRMAWLRQQDNNMRFPVKTETISQKLRVPVILLMKKLLPVDWFYKRREKLATKYSIDECERGFTQLFERLLVRRSKHLLHAAKLPFEDGEYYCPADYDEFLTDIYGDWRTLPPEEKRSTGSHKSAYISTEKSYLTRWWEQEQGSADREADE